MKTKPTRSKRQAVLTAKIHLDPLNPDNWDFRWVTKDNLQAVIDWEYYREANPELSLPPARHLPASHGLFTPVKRSSRALHIIEHDRVSPCSLAHLATRGSHFLMHVDFSGHGVNKIIKEFGGWARREHARRTRLSRKCGRAASPPWHRLKQLAAKRLRDQELSYEQAQQLVAALKSPATHSPGDVLPNYASSGAWHDAITGAQQFLEGNPTAKRFVDRIGRRRWWKLFRDASGLAATRLKVLAALPLSISARDSGYATRLLRCAQWLGQKKSAANKLAQRITSLASRRQDKRA